MNEKLFKIVDYGKYILEIEKIINSTRYMKKGEQIRDIMKDIKVMLVDELIKEYKTVDEAPTIEEVKSIKEKLKAAPKEETIIPDEDKTLEELSEDEELTEDEVPEKFIEPVKPKTTTRAKVKPKTTSRKTTKRKSAYSKK